jgi:hypothetical protein
MWVFMEKRNYEAKGNSAFSKTAAVGLAGLLTLSSGCALPRMTSMHYHAYTIDCARCVEYDKEEHNWMNLKFGSGRKKDGIGM